MLIQRTEQCDKWLRSLPKQVQVRILIALERIADSGQLLGDYKSVGKGVIELRFHFGKGYRVYCYEEKGRLLILLAGGDKSTQTRDIKKAQELLKEWKEQ
ncbi:MAG: type II toxin-antitoxin system RelE/ParE family toxin [Actinomycetaceae bacterium]|nr:type II toxin-antitoxin system RelE/ParE family toxin [Actinomycetaceae bacterium]